MMLSAESAQIYNRQNNHTEHTMRLRHIEVFHAIYVTGSVTNAAEFLHVSQPSVSKVLAHAEQQLGFALFDRVKGRLIATEEAVLLFGEVDKVYHQIRSVDNCAQNIKNKTSGSITIGLPPALGFDLIPQAVASYKKRHPNVRCNLKTMHYDEVLQALIEHKIDFALMFSPPPLPGIKQHLVCQSQMVLIYPRDWLPDSPTQVNLQLLEQHEVIGIGDSGPLGDSIWNRLTQENINVNPTIEVQTYFIAAQLVAQQAGICVVDEFTARGNLSEKVAIAAIEPALNFKVKALQLGDKPLSQVANNFLELVTQLSNSHHHGLHQN